MARRSQPPRPLTELSPATLAALRFVLTDIDDTLTDDGRLPARAYAALEDLQAAGVVVIPVTGRPAGWCDLIARLWPVDGVVGENGALAFSYERGQRRMRRVYRDPAPLRADNRERLDRLVADLAVAVPRARLASDQAYRECDVAIDICEDLEPHLSEDEIAAITDFLVAGGATLRRSSIHLNAWFGEYDKLAMARRLLGELFDTAVDGSLNAIAYVGDSPNDGSMFAHFPISVGVANVGAYLDGMADPPAFLCAQPGARGFAEFAARVLAARAR
mgnify:CR=1 FL=1